jgi:RNA polymerase sigma-B factor
LTLGPLLAGLTERERQILLLRFYGGMTQSAIGARLGLSQMHLSRLLSGILAHLRHELIAEA